MIKKPKNWRIGQTIFNFLEWLRVNKKIDSNQSSRMADPFHISDEIFNKYYDEFISLSSYEDELFEQYNHVYSSENNKSSLVWVITWLKGKHRDHCLCYHCNKFKPCKTDNCKIAEEIFKNCIKFDLVTPVYECPEFKKGDPDFSGFKTK